MKTYPGILSLLMFFVFIPVLSMSQMEVNLNKDSLRLVLASMPADSNKALKYITLGQQYEENTPDSAVYYYEQARILSEKINYPTGIIKYISNYTAVLNLQGKFDESLKLNLKAVELSKKHGLKKSYLASVNNVGAVYQYKDQKEQALYWYLKALPLLEEDGNQQNLGIFYSNLCILYKDLKQYNKAIDAGKRSFQIGEATKDLYIEGMAANNLGEVYIELNKMEDALKYMNRTYQVGKALKSLFYEETGLLGIGTYYLRKKLPEKYIPIFQRALPLADSVQDLKGKTHALMGIGVGYYYKRQLDQAEKTLSQAIADARKYDLKESLPKAYLFMSDVLIAQGRYEDAENVRAIYDSIQDASLNVTVMKNAQEMESKYELQKKQNEILQKNLLLEKQHAASSRQRNWLIASLVGVCLLVLLIFFIYRYFRQKLLLDQKQIEAMKTEQENIRLKAIVEGQAQERQRISQEMHDDMGSGLTSILYLSHTLSKTVEDPALRKNAEKLSSTATGLIEKMNEIIWMMNDKFNSLEDLIAYMRVNVSETLDNADIGCQFKLPEVVPNLPLSQKYRRNIYLIVKEAVHNVIKHANANKVMIEVDVDNLLTIKITDNGKGINLENKRMFSNGLRNMQQRAEEIQGEVQITSRQGTTLQLQVSLAA